MTIANGARVDPWRLNPTDVDIKTIAHSLSQLCRFGGHTTEFYSVAQHCVRAANLVSPQLALEALLHDATEFIVQDLVRPVKRPLVEYCRLEDRIWNVVAFRFGLPGTQSDQVLYADELCIKSEIHQFLPNPGRDEELSNPYWNQFPLIAPVERAWMPKEAEAYFMMTYAEALAKRIEFLQKGEVQCSRCSNGECRKDCALYSEMQRSVIQ